ncbi:hypothetical protein JOF41_005780 [Saccharothrix coeruleofusca]|nr:hypothetical protein [Saccharothrix coeruleofusca]
MTLGDAAEQVREMSSGRHALVVGSVAALAASALLVVLVNGGQPRPVDVRRVDTGPTGPDVLSATLATSVQAVRSTEVAPPPLPRSFPAPLPAQPPAVTTPPHPVTVTTTTTAPPPTTTTAPPSSEVQQAPPEGSDGCDHAYVTNTGCVPWEFPRHVWWTCLWLREQGITRVEVPGRDRHHLDTNRDGVGCAPR